MVAAVAASSPNLPADQQRSAAPANPRLINNNLPLLPPGIERGARPISTIRVAYQFAAEHPEVMKFVPCFCGCERGGHKDNHDCFVSSRSAAGAVTGWEPHGIVCEICLDVATQAWQMNNSGASVSAIREAIEKKYASRTAEGLHTPTPLPKKGGKSHH